jgi:hypothetical protein
MKFEITDLRNSTVWNLYRMRNRIMLDPEYQRLSDIWTMDKRQLLIDTILNEFDVPKLYLHKFHEPVKKGSKTYDYAIIDGKQRLETIWSFIDGNMALADDFEFFKDGDIKAGSMTYKEVGKAYPDLKVQFDSFQLATVVIDTEDIEMIEEMFSRLNESAPLTAPEKRNAYGGPLPGAIRKLAGEPFFTGNLPFPNRRYRHFDLATKFLFAEYKMKVADTKKAYLDEFVESFAGQPRTKAPPFLKGAQENVARMATVFTQRDPLLRQVGIVTLYYHLFRIASEYGWEQKITRKRLADFEKVREENRAIAEQGLTKANYDLLEFDRYAQSPNDGVAIKFRLKILLGDVFDEEVSTDDL